MSFADCSPDRIPALRSFFAEMYSPDYVLSRDEAFLRWQFGEARMDTSENYHLILGLVDDEIRGCIGFIPVELTIGGRIVRGAWAANWMVDEKLRRLGLGPLLIRELTKRFDVTLALGGNRDAHDLLPRMGWTDFGALKRYVCVLDADSAARLTENGQLEWPIQHREVSRDASAGGRVARVERFDADATALWDRHWSDAAGTRRSAEFLNWRYGTHPNFTHRLFELRDRGNLAGVGVYRLEDVRDVPVRIGRILELIAEPAEARLLLRGMIADARSQGVAALDFFCSSRRLDSALEAEGFLPGTEAPASELPILFQPIDRDRSGILFMADLRKVGGPGSDWYVTKSDGDQDRPS